MLALQVGRLLKLHELLTIERGHFERAARDLAKKGSGNLIFEGRHHLNLTNAVKEVELIAGVAGLDSTTKAAGRTLEFLTQNGEPHNGQNLQMPAEACKNTFHHLMDICSRIRDDCEGRLYFQIDPTQAAFLKDDAQHFGADVERIFPSAVEDIAEAGACLAFGRTTASVFHLMRAAESAVFAIAKRLQVRRLDKNRSPLSWGQLLPSIGTKIQQMKPGKRKDGWLKIHVLLHAVNRAWRVEVSHGGSDLRPKKTYTFEEAQRAFDATKALMQELITLV